MKERLKRFYQDHSDGCNAIVTGLACLGSLFALHKARGMRIDGISDWHNDEGAQLIRVHLKNGDTRNFTKEPQKV